MKPFIFAVIFVACAVYSVTDNTQSGQLVAQIQCYLRKLRASLPADAVPQVEAVIKDEGSVEYNLIHFNAKGVGRSFRDASNQLTIMLPILRNPKLRALCIEMNTKLKAAATKFESGNGNFLDILTLNTIIRNDLKEHFGGGCGESTLPKGQLSTDEPRATIKDDYTKLKALAPANARPIYDQLAENVDAVQKASAELDRKKVIEVLKKDVSDRKKLIATMTDTDKRQHQVEILEKVEVLIKKLDSGKGTFLDVYNVFYLYIEKQLAQDV